MKAKKYRVLVLFVVCTSTYAIITYAARPTITTREFSLKDLPGVGVKIYLDENDKQYGLTEQVLQVDTELRLRKFDITVFSDEQWKRVEGEPLLTVAPTVVSGDEVSFAAVSIKVKLYQNVLLQRNPNLFPSGIYPHGITWEVGGTVLCRKDEVRKSVREHLKDFINQFIYDYLAVNPKETKEGKDNKPKDEQKQ